MTTRLEALCAALRANGATILVESRSALRARGPGVQALAEEIRYWKPELLRGLFSSRGAEPYACAGCGCEVVTEAEARCEWCHAAAGRALEIIPSSLSERAFLDRVALSLNPSQLSQPSNERVLGSIGMNGIISKIHPNAAA